VLGSLNHETPAKSRLAHRDLERLLTRPLARHRLLHRGARPLVDLSHGAAARTIDGSVARPPESGWNHRADRECLDRQGGSPVEEAGKPLNEGRTVAESTLTSIMGRMSAYTGQAITWDFVAKKSKLDLSPPKHDLCETPVPPVAAPGVGG
jgi:hypothetical protein